MDNQTIILFGFMGVLFLSLVMFLFRDVANSFNEEPSKWPKWVLLALVIGLGIWLLLNISGLASA